MLSRETFLCPENDDVALFVGSEKFSSGIYKLESHQATTTILVSLLTVAKGDVACNVSLSRPSTVNVPPTMIF